MLEIVVLEGVDVRFDHQISRLPPKTAVHLLRNGKALTDHLEHMPRPLAVRPLPSQMHGQHALGSHLLQRNCGHGVRQHAVHQ